MLETGRENTHRGREWSMRAHDGVKGPTGQQSTITLTISIIQEMKIHEVCLCITYNTVGVMYCIVIVYTSSPP